MEYRELHWPPCPGRSVSAHESSAEQHVLRTHKDRGTLGSVNPASGIDTSHEDVNVIGSWEKSVWINSRRLQMPHPSLDLGGHLLNERAHRQAPHEPARCGSGLVKPVVRPRQGYPCGLSRPRGGDQDLRPIAFGKGALPTEGRRRSFERDVKEVAEVGVTETCGRGGIRRQVGRAQRGRERESGTSSVAAASGSVNFGLTQVPRRPIPAAKEAGRGMSIQLSAQRPIVQSSGRGVDRPDTTSGCVLADSKFPNNVNHT